MYSGSKLWNLIHPIKNDSEKMTSTVPVNVLFKHFYTEWKKPLLLHVHLFRRKHQKYTLSVRESLAQL